MEKTGGSRLLQMQARFQQKQLQERELKIASLYEAQQARALDRVRHSPVNGVVTTPAQPTVAHQPGKVRQMFEERRTKAGIDKSYPLQPIHDTERAPPKKTLLNGHTKVSTNRTLEKKSSIKTHTSISTHSMKKQNVQVQKTDNLVNGTGDLNHNHEQDLNTKGLAQVVGDLSKDEIDHGNDGNVTESVNYLLENETFPESLAPLATPRSPERRSPTVAVEVKKTIRRSPATRTKSPVKSKPIQTSTTPRRNVNESKVSDIENNKPKSVMQKGTSSSPQANSVNKIKPVAPVGDGGCPSCGRHFAPDRLDKHVGICKKSRSKKRKPFDVLKHRLAGTEAESFISKIRKNTAAPSTTKTQKSSSSSSSNSNSNSGWRQKHEEFIQAIRAAKQVQAHLNAGGKLSELPPPPPSENRDYVQCPHCGRRFNQAAAERHIPKCANFQFNKPKPPPKRR